MDQVQRPASLAQRAILRFETHLDIGWQSGQRKQLLGGGCFVNEEYSPARRQSLIDQRQQEGYAVLSFTHAESRVLSEQEQVVGSGGKWKTFPQ